ncbi:high-affinity branched-chain amino acid ABC transporter permease LivM [Pseudomonas seleniipraecipitans]|uniref:High-affinity branched-chain amino acid ABC transporter permease LivM n=1 Tax=Phytopseudomonas seleniipraecipitans TaxID=640205 RepID=A0A1G7NPS5_9GAMM|nr:high-affinity branched-chain amino acid ABC transporter permease LivM [Pseudomonas seleniipraecipitans]NQD78917.1 high-affinity branched-chain amino acid ABC transporter permease LivM [Pseudomonas sp. CrR14]UUD65076.1 high-affinity branched-chain amino acid ABC transporter permease LivM [Pseudomonas seleniipraecipitans]SDF75927.1 L-leucine ABC transporter membrane protein /L-isoleucine ABC transporter membrane protein /L-valine ABC transporter membrane protein [Pseudomonas seleniipraecipitans
MSKNLKTALFSSILLLLISYPILGLKLSVVGISLQVQGASAKTLWTIGIAAALLFIWHLVLRDRLLGGEKLKGALPSVPQNLKDALTLPSVQRWIMLALFVVALAWPFFGSRAAVDIATLILIYVMLGIGLNIVVGLAGLLDLGYVGFYAVGAYTYALLAEYAGFGFWTALPIAGLMAATFGCLLGFPVLRLRGDYLAIVTLGFGEIIRIMLRNLTEITGGPNGISSIPKPELFGLSLDRRAPDGGQTLHDFLGIAYNSTYKVIFLYLIALLLVLLAIFVINRLMRMPIGRAWEALREDEIACRALGLNPTTVKLSAFTIGASFAGFAGSFFAARQGLVTPESFTFIESAMILAIVVLGGMGSQLGIIFAAIVMTLLQEMRDFNEYRMLIFGLTMIVMMIWRPQGLLPMQRPHLELKQR